MSMQKYLVTEAFTLSLINNPALSMGLSTKVGEVLFYDGFNVEYNGIRDASVSLKAAIREGWLRVVGETEEVPMYETSSPTQAPAAQEMFENVAPTSVASSNNNGHLVMVEGSSAKRGMPVETVEGNTVRKTAFDDAGSRQNHSTSVSTERQKLGVIMGEDMEIVAPLKGNREAVAMSSNNEGAIKMGARAVSAKQQALIENRGENPPPVDGEAIPMRRMVPAKMTIELDASSPKSEEGFDKLISKNAGLGTQGSTLEAKAVTTVVDEGEGMGKPAVGPSSKTMESSAIAPPSKDQSLTNLDSTTRQAQDAPILQKTHSSGINEKEQTPRKRIDDFQLKKNEATARLKAKQQAPKDPTPAAVAVSDVNDLVVGGKKWSDIDYKSKVAYVKTFKDPTLLEAIRVHVKSHWSVRKAAKEQISALA